MKAQDFLFLSLPEVNTISFNDCGYFKSVATILFLKKLQHNLLQIFYFEKIVTKRDKKKIKIDY